MAGAFLFGFQSSVHRANITGNLFRVEITNLHVLFYSVVADVVEVHPGAPKWIASGADNVRCKQGKNILYDGEN